MAKISKRQQRLSEKKIKLETAGLTPAQVVIKTYPSFSKIFQYALEKVGGVKGSLIHKFYMTLPEEYKWEAVSDLVDAMVEQQLGRPFHKDYYVKVNKNTGFSSIKDCEATVYDCFKQEHEVTGDEFLALLKIMAVSWMNYQEFNYDMQDAYNEFMGSSDKIYSILD